MTDIRPLRSYGRRKAKPLSARKERLIGELLPRLRLDLSGPPPAALTELFQRPSTMSGSRSASAPASICSGRPRRIKMSALSAASLSSTASATLLGAIEDRGIGTIRVHDGDAREVLGLASGPFDRPGLPAVSRSLAEEAAVEAAAALRRHARRDRARAAVPAANSDLPPTTATMPRKRCASRSKAIFSPGPPRRATDWRERPADWPETRYERKALSEGRKSTYLSFSRR